MLIGFRDRPLLPRRFGVVVVSINSYYLNGRSKEAASPFTSIANMSTYNNEGYILEVKRWRSTLPQAATSVNPPSGTILSMQK